MATLKDLQRREQVVNSEDETIKEIDLQLAGATHPAIVAALSAARAALVREKQSKNAPAQQAAPVAATPAPSASPATGLTANDIQAAAARIPDPAARATFLAAQSAPAPTASPAVAAPAAQPNLTKPDPASGDFWKVTTGADGTTKTEFDGTKYQAAYDAWYASMNAAGYPTANYNSSPAGTVGQIGAGRDANGQVYSAMTGPDGNTQMLNAQQIQQSVRQDANPQTSRDRAAADSLVAIIKGWGLQDDVQVGEMGAITFPSPKALTAYTGIVSQRMLDVLRNGGTQVDALNAGGYQVVARESDAWKAYAAQQGGK